MKSNNNMFWLVILIALSFTIFKGVADHNYRDVHGIANQAPIAVAEPDDVLIGDPGIKDTIVALLSVTCVHCSKWELEQLPDIKQKLVDTGKIKIAIREMPLDRASLVSGSLIACFPQEQRLAVRERLVRTRGNWESLPSEQLISAIFKSLGIESTQALEECALEKQKTVFARAQKMQNDYGARGTPAFIMNKHIVTGSLTTEQMQRFIEETNGPPLAQ